jgi:hypothetical protein
MDMSNDVMERWRGFVQKVTGRLTEILNESNAGFEGLLADPALDPITFANAMNAITLRYKDLRTKLATTYSEQVVLPTFAGGEAKALLDQGETWMEDSWERFRTGWNGRLVRTLWTRVGPLMHRPAQCSRCGAQLTRTVFHQAESVTCQSCQSVNSVSPDPLVYTYFAMAPDMIADEQTIHMKIAVERAQHAGASKSQVEALWQQYFEAYAKARATIAPMSADEIRSYSESRMKHIRMYG